MHVGRRLEVSSLCNYQTIFSYTYIPNVAQLCMLLQAAAIAVCGALDCTWCATAVLDRVRVFVKLVTSIVLLSLPG
jgi:hypothetical protein